MDIPFDSTEELSYGCASCKTGKETLVALTIEQFCRDASARAVCQEKRFTCKGEVFIRNEVVIKGYVFFQVHQGRELKEIIPPDNSVIPLIYSGGDWRLFGEDEKYAKWIFKYDGTLSFSKAYQIGEKIVIADGPLKDLEGFITKIDKRNRNGQVTIQFAGREQKIWLGFEIIKSSDK